MEDGRKQSQAAAGSLTAIWKPGYSLMLMETEFSFALSLLSLLEEVKVSIYNARGH